MSLDLIIDDLLENLHIKKTGNIPNMAEKLHLKNIGKVY